jgi:hypothetical protein
MVINIDIYYQTLKLIFLIANINMKLQNIQELYFIIFIRQDFCHVIKILKL